ncbi:MAG: DJ-1/PfpI family protein [Tenuifilaceae bacterium]|jgi:4-methyl-5(b-hydroxyethyl)-thiazole monophosphate biosynthesis|nr:DJ-1/PfpI family protein [Tenuifilaceae bacterium]
MKKVLLLLPNGFEVLEASAFIDVMGWNHLEGDGSTMLYTCGLRKEIVSSFNQRFIVDILIDEVDVESYDALAIPGGFEEYSYYTDAYDERVLNLIRSFNDKSKVIASICVAALPLGRSGVLNGKDATTYNSPKRREALLGYGVNLVDNPIVQTGNITTSYGPSTAIDVAFLLLEQLTSQSNTDAVAKLMGFNR